MFRSTDGAVEQEYTRSKYFRYEPGHSQSGRFDVSPRPILLKYEIRPVDRLVAPTPKVAEQSSCSTAGVVGQDKTEVIHL
jgi:hypothetical protein